MKRIFPTPEMLVIRVGGRIWRLLNGTFIPITGVPVLAVILAVWPFTETKAQSGKLDIQILEDFHSNAKLQARKPLTDADNSYRTSLEKQQKAAQDAGDLKGVLAAKQAIIDLDTGRTSVSSDDPSVAMIQKAYIALRQNAVVESAKALAKADEEHVASLKKLVVELTKKGHIEQAQVAQEKVDVLASLLKSKATPGQSTAGAQEIEIWKSKAQEEFPALKDQTSPLSKQIKAAMEQKKATPTYFKNPQWPYLLAKECHEAIVQQEAFQRKESQEAKLQQETFQRFQGVYGEAQNWYIFSVDDAGSVVGFQFLYKKKYFSEILGKIAGQSFTSKWVQSISNSTHEYIYTLQKDSNIRANGSHRSGNKIWRWNGTLIKIHDKAECIRALDLASSFAKEADHIKAIAKIKDSYLIERP